MAAKARKPRRKRSLLAGKTATIWVERNGAGLKMEDVPASEAPLLLADLLAAFRALEKSFPEMIQDLGAVPGGAPIDVTDDDWADDGRRRKRLGFT